jgi:hypothetical protein
MFKRTMGAIIIALSLGTMLAVPAQAVDPEFTGYFAGTIHRVSGPPRVCGRNDRLDWRIRTVNLRTRHVRSLSGRYSLTLKYRRHAWREEYSARGWDYRYVLRYHDAQQVATGGIVARYGRLVRCEYTVELLND